MPTDLPDRPLPDRPTPGPSAEAPDRAETRGLRPAGSLELDPAAEGVATDETARLIASSKVEGSAVYDRAGERLGTIHTVMIDKISGQVAYAVLAAGGFLGLGEAYHPLPWRSLAYSVELGGYVVDIDATALSGERGEAETEGEPAAGPAATARSAVGEAA